MSSRNMGLQKSPIRDLTGFLIDFRVLISLRSRFKLCLGRACVYDFAYKFTLA